MQHEVSQLFRKEQRDFCVLQQEKIEGVKYIISLLSVDCPECPLQPDIIRAKVSKDVIYDPNFSYLFNISTF